MNGALPILTFKALIITASDNILKHFFFLFIFSKHISLNISCELNAKKRIHMKHQDLFSLKNKKKKNRILTASNFVWCFKGEIEL